MAIQKAQNLETVMPSDKEIELAKQSSRILSKMALKKGKSIDIVLDKAQKEQKNVTLPVSAFKLLINILTEMSEGNAITLTPVHAELTTQEAANILNVPHVYLVGLLDAKKIPYRKVGARKKILLRDVMIYKAKSREKSYKLLEELVEDAQKLDMGY